MIPSSVKPLFASLLIWGIGSTGLAEEANVQTAKVSSVEPSPTSKLPLITFKHLGETTPDKNYLPVFSDTLGNLKDQKISIRGFMVPYDSLNDLKQFMLMEVYIGCNFCTPPPLDQVVLIQQEEPNPPLTAQPYVDGPIEVTGDLKLWEKNSSIKVFAERSFLFILENATVKSLPPGSFRAKPSPHAKGRHPGIQNKQDPALPPGR